MEDWSVTCEVTRVVRPIKIKDENLIFSNVLEDDHPVWVSTREYELEDKVIYKHRIYECVQEGKGKEPDLYPDFWVDERSTNRWAMIDGKVGSQTEKLETIEVEVGNYVGFIDTLALLNVEGLKLTVLMVDDLEGEVFRREYPLVDYSCGNWHQYFFKPIEPQRDIVISDLPPYSGARIRILVETTPTSLAKIGELIIGSGFEIGTPLWGSSVAIRDFSEKSFDEYGNISIIERDWAKRPELDLEIPTNRVNYVMDELSKMRAVPCLYIGHKRFTMTIAYGFYRDLMLVLANNSYSSCTLIIEALT